MLIYYISVQIYTVCYIYLLQQSHTELATNGTNFCYIYLLQQSRTELATNGTDFCYIYLLQQLHNELAINGTSFRSSDQTGSIISSLSANETAAAFLPASLFNLIQNHGKLGIYFNVYNSGVLFPVKNETQSLGSNSSVTTVIGSPVLAATVGPMLSFSGLAEPVRILLRLNEELEVSIVEMGVRNSCVLQHIATLCTECHKSKMCLLGF